MLANGPSVFKGGDRASFLRQLRKAACENDFPIDDASGRTKLSCKGRCRRIDLPVSAVRFTHNTVDGHPVFLHDENAQSKKTSLWTFHICPSILHMSIDFHVLPGGDTQSATGMPSGSAPDESGGLPHKDEPRIVKVRTKRG